MQQINLGGDKSRPSTTTPAARKIAFDDPTPASDTGPRVLSNRGDDFVMLDFKTPFSMGTRTLSSASDLQASVSAATTDLVSSCLHYRSKFFTIRFIQPFLLTTGFKNERC